MCEPARAVIATSHRNDMSFMHPSTLRSSVLATTSCRRHTGSLVVDPFALPGAGQGCYVIDPAGVLIGRTPTTRGRKVNDRSP